MIYYNKKSIPMVLISQGDHRITYICSTVKLICATYLVFKEQYNVISTQLTEII